MAGDQAGQTVLYSYWRSSSAYRVRIALNLKGISHQQEYVHLVRDGGEQNRPEYRKVNPLGLVPALVHEGRTIVQSMAIIEYLEDVFPGYSLLPADPVQRSRVRGIAQSICSEIQPLNNLAVMQYLKDRMQQPDESIRHWYSHWIDRGFSAVEAWLSCSESGDFCHGDSPGLADCYLVPQVYNAERFSCDLRAYPNIQRITTRCREEEAFARAAPENQADAP